MQFRKPSAPPSLYTFPRFSGCEQARASLSRGHFLHNVRTQKSNFQQFIFDCYSEMHAARELEFHPGISHDAKEKENNRNQLLESIHSTKVLPGD